MLIRLTFKQCVSSITPLHCWNLWKHFLWQLCFWIGALVSSLWAPYPFVCPNSYTWPYWHKFWISLWLLRSTGREFSSLTCLFEKTVWMIIFPFLVVLFGICTNSVWVPFLSNYSNTGMSLILVLLTCLLILFCFVEPMLIIDCESLRYMPKLAIVYFL